MTIRAFVALPPPAALIAPLEDLGHDLDCGRPVPEEDLHLTLAFLGEHDRHVLEDVALELDRIRLAAPMIGFDGVDRFGSKKPTAAHALCTPSPELSALHDAVRRAAAAGGVALKRRRFIPHVTLARFPAAHPADGDLERWSEAHAGFAAGPLAAPYFALYRSELSRGGPVYTEAMRFAFA